MLTFSVYVSHLTAHPWASIGQIMLVIGWGLSVWFFYSFYTCEGDKAHLDDCLRCASRTSVAMDVGGKLLTYAVIIFGDTQDEDNMPRVFFLMDARLAWSMIKWQHASHARAREVEQSDSERCHPLIAG